MCTAVSSSAPYNAYGTMSFVSNDQWGQPAVSATHAALDELSHLSLNNSSPRSVRFTLVLAHLYLLAAI